MKSKEKPAGRTTKPVGAPKPTPKAKGLKSAAGRATKPVGAPEPTPKAKGLKPAAKRTAEPAGAPEMPPNDGPRIESRLLVGEYAVSIDASSLEHTLGSGRWVGRGMIDQWPDGIWVGLLVHLGLPAEPLDREAAKAPVWRLIQRLWYEAVKGGYPEERRTVLEARDAEAASVYKDGFVSVKASAADRKERASKSFGRSGKTVYAPTAALKAKGLAVGGQAGILLKFFKDTKFAPATTAQATEGMVAAGLKTSTKPERIAAFYLCQWVKKSWLERTTV